LSSCNSIVSIFDDLKLIKPPSPYWPESANVYVFRDGDGVSFFDVGCGAIASVERIFSALKNLKWTSRPVQKVILSHAHPDHVGAMEVLLAEISPEFIILHEIDIAYALDPQKLSFSFDIPLCNERLTRGRSQNKNSENDVRFDLIGYFRSLNCSMCIIEPNSPVVEGDAIDVGDYSFRVFHTPGHAPGHISLYESSKRLLLAGDLIGEIVAWYTPSSGGVEGYLDSLRKIDDLDVDLILPSHGDLITDAKKAIKETREKILERDNVINDALQNAPKTFEELNRALFDKPNIQFFPGIPILESHLQKLINEGKVRKEGPASDRFCIS